MPASLDTQGVLIAIRVHRSQPSTVASHVPRQPDLCPAVEATTRARGFNLGKWMQHTRKQQDTDGTWQFPSSQQVANAFHQVRCHNAPKSQSKVTIHSAHHSCSRQTPFLHHERMPPPTSTSISRDQPPFSTRSRTRSPRQLVEKPLM